jgi:hypothetical protein
MLVPAKDQYFSVVPFHATEASPETEHHAQERSDAAWANPWTRVEEEFGTSPQPGPAPRSIISSPVPKSHMDLTTGIAIGVVGMIVIMVGIFLAWNSSSHNSTSAASTPTGSQESTPSQMKPSPDVSAPASGTDSTDISAPPMPVSQASSDEGETSALNSDPRPAVQKAVIVWADAFRSRNVPVLAASYAPTVEQYFRKSNVDRDQIQQYFQSAFARMQDIHAYEVDNIKVEMLPSEDAVDGGIPGSRAAATFHKSWETVGVDGKTFSGEEIEKLTFTNLPEGWKIVREEELQIIRASKH